MKFSGAGISVASTVVGSPTSITASVTITGGAATGPRDVTVTNPGKVTATCTGCFSINARPTVSSAAPGSRPQGASHQAVTVTGTAFQPGATATVSGTGVTVHSTSFVSATALTLDVSVDATAATGNRTISVVNPDGGTSTGSATFAVNALPTATSVSPVNVRRGATTNVQPCRLGVLLDVRVRRSRLLRPGHHRQHRDPYVGDEAHGQRHRGGRRAAGQRSLVVTNPDGGSATCANCVNVVADPQVAGVAPASAGQGVSARVVVVTGSGFAPGATAKFSSTGITVNSVTVTSPSSITLTVTVTGAAAVGAATSRSPTPIPEP